MVGYASDEWMVMRLARRSGAPGRPTASHTVCWQACKLGRNHNVQKACEQRQCSRDLVLLLLSAACLMYRRHVADAALMQGQLGAPLEADGTAWYLQHVEHNG